VLVVVSRELRDCIRIKVMEIQLLFRLFSNAALTRAMMVAVIMTCMLTGCAGSSATATPYQPAEQVGEEGYSSHRLSEDKYKIMFKANSVTSITLLEQYGQRRAMEIASEQDFRWYRVISSDAINPSALENQQVVTAAPKNTTVNGAVTGEVKTSKLPTNQQCTMSGCEAVNETLPATNPDADEQPRFYTMTIQLGRFNPAPDDAIKLH